jgi:hypothetical protein
VNVNDDPKSLLEALCADADPRKARSLRLIHAICEEQRDRGSKDYSVATIGRLSAGRGGPAVGAIRNKTGETYRALIKIFAGSVAGKTRKAADGDIPHANLILEGATDPVLRARVGLLVAELKATRAQLLAARHLANQHAVVDLQPHLPVGSALPDAPVPAPRLSPLEVRALENAISGLTLTHWGWSADASGRIVTDTGHIVFGAGFVTAIGKVLQGHRSDVVQNMTLISLVP